MDAFALCLTPKNYFHIFVVGDSLKVCTWVAEGTGQVVYTFASVGARSHSGASSFATPKAESGTASSASRRPRVIITEDEPSEPTAASSSFVADPYCFSGPQWHKTFPFQNLRPLLNLLVFILGISFPQRCNRV